MSKSTSHITPTSQSTSSSTSPSTYDYILGKNNMNKEEIIKEFNDLFKEDDYLDESIRILIFGKDESNSPRYTTRRTEIIDFWLSKLEAHDKELIELKKKYE